MREPLSVNVPRKNVIEYRLKLKDATKISTEISSTDEFNIDNALVKLMRHYKPPTDYQGSHVKGYLEISYINKIRYHRDIRTHEILKVENFEISLHKDEVVYQIETELPKRELKSKIINFEGDQLMSSVGNTSRTSSWQQIDSANIPGLEVQITQDGLRFESDDSNNPFSSTGSIIATANVKTQFSSDEDKRWHRVTVSDTVERIFTQLGSDSDTQEYRVSGGKSGISGVGTDIDIFYHLPGTYYRTLTLEVKIKDETNFGFSLHPPAEMMRYTTYVYGVTDGGAITYAGYRQSMDFTMR